MTVPIAIIALLVIAIAIGVLMTLMYNSLVRLRQGVGESWAGVDVELKRRHDLIPNLVQTVQGYAAHERGVFEDVTNARSAAIVATGRGPAQRSASEGALTGALGRLFAVAEAYPELRAVEQFSTLSANLASTENKIEAARSMYNARVKDYNTAVQRFPATLMAGMMGFHAEEYFEVTEPAHRDVPRVGFGA